MGYYEELEVAPSATPAEIRRSYLALARRFHPDGLAAVSQQERDRASARMARINAAWSVLSDEDRRAAYDVASGHGRGTGATIRDVGRSWVAFDTDEDDVDPRLLDDTPTGAPTLRRSFTFLPACLAVAGGMATLTGFVIGLSELLAVGLVVLAVAALSFLVIPLVALANSSRADKYS